MDISKFPMPSEVFMAVIGSSTWGSSKGGGPVWIMDFRLENLKKLCPQNWWVEALEEQVLVTKNDGLPLLDTYRCIHDLAKKFILGQQLCNVLVVTDYINTSNPDMTFFSLFSYCKKISEILHGRESKIPLRQISDILRAQSPKIIGDDFVWYVSLSSSYQGGTSVRYGFPDWSRARKCISGSVKTDNNEYVDVCVMPYPVPSHGYVTYDDRLGPRIFKVDDSKWLNTMVYNVKDWEIWIPNVIYDTMELASMKYWESKGQYPLMHYNKNPLSEGVNKIEEPFTCCGTVYNQLELNIPKVSDPENWHKDFFPKQYWKTYKD